MTAPRRPSEALAAHLAEVREVIAHYPVSNPRVFGSVARGEDRAGSDLDILIHPENGVTYFDLARLALEPEGVLGVSLDLGEDTGLRSRLAGSIVVDVRPL